MEAAGDRLSSLPDELLFTVVSFLPFKEAVRTSVLAKRWRLVPLGTKNLEFKETEFVGKQEIQRRRDFVDYVQRWINRTRLEYNLRGVKFLLEFSRPEDDIQRMQQFVRFAIDRGVQVLDLDFSDPTWEKETDVVDENHDSPVQLPRIDDGEFRNLQSLKLSSCNVPVISPFSPNFSALKRASFAWITMSTTRMNHFLEKCPVLESLSMRRCRYSNGYLEIISKSLRSLAMEKCCSTEPDSSLHFHINAPEMQSFEYSGVLLGVDCQSLNLDLEASLDFGCESEFGEFGDTFYSLLVALGGVRKLTVCSYVLQVLPLGEEPFGLRPELERLKHLTLKASLSLHEFYGITFFLHSCPNLEILTINLNTPKRIFQDYEPPLSVRQHQFLMNSCPDLRLVYPCVKKKLKRVEIEGFRGTMEELLVLRYLLTFGRVLETLHVKISQETAADGTSMEDSYVARVHSLKRFNIASQSLRILISRRG